MSRILVDTSIWIDFFRDADLPTSETLDRLLELRLVCTTDVIRAEIIPGARTDREFRRLLEYFGALPSISAGPDFWNEVIQNRYLLNRKGVSGIGIPDVMVATVALEHQKLLYSKDHHFRLIGRHLPLRLFEGL